MTHYLLWRSIEMLEIVNLVLQDYYQWYHTFMYIIMTPSDAANKPVRYWHMYVCLFGLANLRERVTLMYTALIRHGWSQQVAPSLSCIASTQHGEFIWFNIINCWRNFAIQYICICDRRGATDTACTRAQSSTYMCMHLLHCKLLH